MQLTVKDVEEKTFREFKAETVRNGLKIGKALTLAMEEWMRKEEKRPKKSLLDIKQKSWGKRTEKTSEEIDNILYG